MIYFNVIIFYNTQYLISLFSKFFNTNDILYYDAHKQWLYCESVLFHNFNNFPTNAIFLTYGIFTLKYELGVIHKLRRQAMTQHFFSTKIESEQLLLQYLLYKMPPMKHFCGRLSSDSAVLSSENLHKQI